MCSGHQRPKRRQSAEWIAGVRLDQRRHGDVLPVGRVQALAGAQVAKVTKRKTLLLLLASSATWFQRIAPGLFLSCLTFRTCPKILGPSLSRTRLAPGRLPLRNLNLTGIVAKRHIPGLLKRLGLVDGVIVAVT